MILGHKVFGRPPFWVLPPGPLAWRCKGAEKMKKHEKVRELHSLSQEVDIPLVNLAICWCLKNKNVSTVILGASKEEQLIQNLGSLKYSDQLDENIMEKIETILKK